MKKVAALAVLVCLLLAHPLAIGAEASDYRRWIEEMKEAPRGPFTQVRWFCRDGTVLPPTPYACLDRGGGAQHGEWSDRTKELREKGFYVANVLAGVDASELLGAADFPELFAQLLMEQFLISIDDGWIMRHARFFRGALQEESERAAARRLLFKMTEDRRWIDTHFLLLRTGARLLSHGAETDEVAAIRNGSADLARRDPGFERLRNKIHVRPTAADADSVRAYASSSAPAELVPEYEDLGRAIDRVYEPAQLVEHLEKLERQLYGAGELPALVAQARRDLEGAESAADRFEVSAYLLAAIRDRLLVPNGPSQRMALIDASVKLESENFVAGTELREQLAHASRRDIIDWLANNVTAMYGAGLLSQRQRMALTEELRNLDASPVTLASYKAALDYLARVPAWGTSAYAFYFGEALQKLSVIEPLAALFIQDQLRGSNMFFFAQALELARQDANRLAGVRSELFGEAVAGLRALNPGVARGVLRTLPAEGASYDRNSIYMLPETIADLPPVAGIITAGEGNPLSHIQLLARNLGIPNVAIDEPLMAKLEAHVGKEIRMGSTAAGSVLIEETGTAPIADAARPGEGVRIVPDLEKLDLGFRTFVTLDELRASDSGRIVGPKAAKLAELKHHYPDAVAIGLVIPFGEFRALLDQPRAEGGSIFDWMVSEYARLGALPADSSDRPEQTEQFRSELEQRIASADPGEDFRTRLVAAMRATFGEDGTYGVFVRSDTNVEDLPGFTGAGLNLTVPNVVGEAGVIAAISRVWASPFTARAFAWRQALMDTPEHVYPAVLLQLTVPVQKSGVLVTRDIDTGADGWLSVAVNEGVGGAVDGQPAESLRVELASGRVRLLAQASTPWQRMPAKAGGVERIRSSGRSEIMTKSDIARLIALARDLPNRFPEIIDDVGKPAPADVEFGFLDGELILFQIRPFLENARARNSAFLAELDAKLVDKAGIVVDLGEPPAAGAER